MPIIQYKKVYTFNTSISVDTFFELLLWSTSDAKKQKTTTTTTTTIYL